MIYGLPHAKTCLHAQAEQRLKSVWASAQSDQDLHCPLKEPLDITECMNGEQRPGWNFVNAQDDLNLRILCMYEGIFNLT